MTSRAQVSEDAAASTSAAEFGFDVRDGLYLAIRAATLVGGAAWTLWSLEPGAARDGLLVAFGVFGPYCVVLYLAGARILRTKNKGTYYLVAAISDLVFVIVLIQESGGAEGPMATALPLWSALYAAYFGLRGGLVTAATMLAVAAAFRAAGHESVHPWIVVGLLTAAVLHGPVVGILSSYVTRRDRQLRVAHEATAVAHRRLVAEQTSLIEAEKHRSVGVLAAGMVHEINNPLSGIIQCARALSEGTVPEERGPLYVVSILEGASRIREVLEGLRDYARRRPAIPGDVDAAELVSSCLRSIAPLAEEAGVRIESALEPGEVGLRAEPSQLKKALANIVMNAIYYSARGESVSITASRRGYMWGVVVADHGPGISRENLSKVTDPFFTTKPQGEGSGLGLAIAFGVVRSFGGELEVASEEGHGTTVTLWLPASGQRTHA